MLLSPEKMDRMNKDTTIHFRAPKEMADNNILVPLLTVQVTSLEGLL